MLSGVLPVYHNLYRQSSIMADEKFTTSGLEEIRQGSVVAAIDLNKNIDAK